MSTILASLTADTIVADMRDWIKDCVDSIDGATDEVDAATAHEVTRYVAANWDGGLGGFLRTMYGDRYYGIARGILRDHLSL